MSILSRIARPDTTEERALPTVSSLEELTALIGGNTATVANAGTIPNALKHPTVWRAVNKIATLYMQMPTNGFIGNRQVDPKPQILLRPSVMYRPSAWKRTAATSMLLRGGVYGLTSAPGPRGQALSVELIHPDRVDWTEVNGWTIDGEPAPPEWPVGNFWQVPLMTLPGSPKGVNPIEYARRTTYAGLAASEFGGNFFRDGAHPTSIVSTATDPGQDGAAALKAKVTAAVSGTTREPLILPSSVTWQQIQVSPEDSQFIELMQFTGGQVAGFFGLNPSDVGLPVEGGSMDYNNREDRQLDVLQEAVMQVIVPLDEALTELTPDSVEARTNVDGLLRADLLARYQSYEISARVEQMTGTPILENEEIRALEHREPLPADKYPRKVDS